MKKSFLFLVSCFVSATIFAFETEKEYVLVYLKDKPEISNERLIKKFSPVSVERRVRQSLDFDESDYPISEKYIDSIKNEGYKVVSHSKWLNALLVEFDKKSEDEPSQLLQYGFVIDYQFLGGKVRTENYRIKNSEQEVQEDRYLRDLSYKLIGLDTLHKLGYHGRGIRIAILDAGFSGVNEVSAFRHLYTQKQIQETLNFWDNSRDVYYDTEHGTKVLSLLSVNNGDEITGSAAQADFFLFKTEVPVIEHPLEEFFYLKALEYCDSIGVDIVNASIGYNYFDDKSYNYRQSDLYTGCALSTKASEYAAGKGMLIVTSAGNEGNLRWKEVTFPADAQDIIAVGVTNLTGKAVSYASYGRDSLNLNRPNLAAPGHKVYTVGANGTHALSYGSSYAVPLISGAAACVWQKYPRLKVKELITVMEQTAQDFDCPDSQKGYGLPDLRKLLKVMEEKFRN